MIPPGYYPVWCMVADQNSWMKKNHKLHRCFSSCINFLGGGADKSYWGCFFCLVPYGWQQRWGKLAFSLLNSTCIYWQKHFCRNTFFRIYTFSWQKFLQDFTSIATRVICNQKGPPKASNGCDERCFNHMESTVGGIFISIIRPLGC